MNPLQQPGWITRILVTLATVALVICGFFFLTVALVVGALVALVVGLRLWWALRKLKRAQAAVDGVSGSAGERVVEGEYQVVERESGSTRLPPQHQRPGQ
jgi:uncharacterized membrane protein